MKMSLVIPSMLLLQMIVAMATSIKIGRGICGNIDQVNSLPTYTSNSRVVDRIIVVLPHCVLLNAY